MDRKEGNRQRWRNEERKLMKRGKKRQKEMQKDEKRWGQRG